MSVSTLCDSSVTQHSGLTLLEKTPKTIKQSSINLKTTETKTTFHIECSKINEVWAKFLRLNRLHSLQDNKIMGKFR